MADTATAAQPTKDDTQMLSIPEDTQQKFPELIEMIKKSRSMDKEERQYWVDVLPIMSADQLDNLRGILTNEKKQMEEAEKAYSSGMEGAVKKATKAFDEAAFKEKKRIRIEAEKKAEAEEKGAEEAILQEISKI